MNPLLSMMAAASRRRGSTRPSTPPSGGIPLYRLVVGELSWAVRQSFHPAKMVTAAVVAIGVGLILGPNTPGPVLGAGWRLAVAVVLGLAGLAVAHALLQRRPGEKPDDLLGAVRVSLAVVAFLLVGTFVTSFLLAFVVGGPTASEPSGLSVSLPIDGPVLAVAALLFGGVITAGISHRVAVPASLSFLLLGMVIGSDGLGWVQVQDAQLVQSLGALALVVILFDGGLGTSARQLRSGLGPGLALATVGVGVTAGITALGAMWLLGVPDRVAWLIGAIVASTDAAAVFGLVRRASVPDRLAAILQLESGANDPIAVLLTVGLLAAWDTPPAAGAWLAFGALQLIGGVVVGVAVGWVGARLLRAVELGSSGLYPVLGLALAGLTYGVAVTLGASGFLAVFVAGVVLGEEAPRRRTAMRSFHGALSSGVEVGLFLLLGLLVLPAQLPAVTATALGVTALLLFVARPLAATVSLAWFDLRGKEVAAISWLGMRGAVPIVLATLAFSAGIEEAALIFDIVFFVVLTSMLMQGATAVSVVRWLGLAQDPGTRPMIARSMPLDSVGVDMVEVDLTSLSPLVGGTLAANPPPEDLLVVAVVRGDDVLLPRGATQLCAGDRVVIGTRDQARGLGRAEAWVRGTPRDLGV